MGLSPVEFTAYCAYRRIKGGEAARSPAQKWSLTNQDPGVLPDLNAALAGEISLPRQVGESTADRAESDPGAIPQNGSSDED